MASIQPRGTKWQVRIKHKLLPRPLFVTFDDEHSASAYARHIEAMLDSGVVPLDLLDPGEQRAASPRLGTLLAKYRASTPAPAPSDLPTLKLLESELKPALRVSDIGATWADEWVRKMKVEQHLAPSTLRKRVEALARVLDWHIRATTEKDKPLPANPLRMMPRGYSAYTPTEAAELAAVEKEAKVDVHRDRRLAPGEEQRILSALAGVKREDRERALPVDPDMDLAFRLIVNTGLRLREMVWMRCEDYDPVRGVLHVRGSKGHRGKEKPRVVPIVLSLRDELKARCDGKTGLVFGFWDGEEPLSNVSNRLSKRFATLFDYAGVLDFKEHDLRHEATCRWVQMKDRQGRWMWTELEIAKMMGWAKLDMMMRYASLRAEDFADRLL